MEPATDQTSGSGGAMRRWGPIIAIVVVAAIVAALVVMGGGDDDEASDDGGDGGPSEEATEVTTEDGEPDLPVQLGRRRGVRADRRPRVGRAVRHRARHRWRSPTCGAAPCYLPFEGDNGGATDEGVTADTIKIVRVPRPRRRPGDQLRHRRHPGGRHQRRHAWTPRTSSSTLLRDLLRDLRPHGRDRVLRERRHRRPTPPPPGPTR